MAGKATPQDIADEGFLTQNFGAPADWAAYLQRQLDRASQWASQKITAANYAAATATSYVFDCLVRAEVGYVAQVLWTRRAAFIDASASLALQDDRRAAITKQYAANAQTASEDACYWIAEAQRAFGIDPTADMGGTGISTGYTETGRFPADITGAAQSVRVAMIGISTNAADVAARIQAKADHLADAVKAGTTSALLAVEAAAVRNLSGSGAPYAYPVPVRTGNLRSNRNVAQPSPGVGVITFNSDYAWAVHSGVVTEFAGRGKTRKVQRTARPFADDAVQSARPSDIVIGAVQKAMAI